MALSSAFRERIQQMEDSRNQRLSLLHAEKQVQFTKSQILASKLSNINSIQHNCLMLDQKIASQHCVISSLKSSLDTLDSDYLEHLQQFRVLKGEVEELEELENGKDSYAALKTRDMDEFRAQANNFAAEYRARVEELRKSVIELNSSYVKLQQSTGYLGNSDLVAAEARKCELLAAKENLRRRLISNYQKRGQLQKQLQSILIAQNEGQREGSQRLKVNMSGTKGESQQEKYSHEKKTSSQ